MWKSIVLLLAISTTAWAGSKTCLPRTIMVLPYIQSTFPVKNVDIDIVSCRVDTDTNTASAMMYLKYHSLSGDVTISELLLPPDHHLKWNGLSFRTASGVLKMDKKFSVQSIAGLVIPKKTLTELKQWFQTIYVPEVERAMRETLHK